MDSVAGTYDRIVRAERPAHGFCIRRGPSLTYRLLFKLVLQRIPANTAHRLAVRLAVTLGSIPGARALTRRLLAPSDTRLAVSALGLSFPSPFGVAAGMDKGIEWFEELGALGFSFVEVGTVTAEPQDPNDPLVVQRLVPDRAVINSMGFPNPGAAKAAKRLRRGRTGHTIVAVNIGRSRKAEDPASDYAITTRYTAPLADFIVLNISSPNTPGLRKLQTPEAIEQLVTTVRGELHALGLETPVLIKISPDLSDDEIDAVADVAVRLRVEGIVAVNTTTARGRLHSRPELLDLPGGLSGAPLKSRALEVLERLYSRTGDALALVSVGGIETAEDIIDRVRAGATLVEGHTGFYYGGPLWPHRVNRALSAHLRDNHIDSIGDLIGAGTGSIRHAAQGSDEPAAASERDPVNAILGHRPTGGLGGSSSS